MGERQRAMVSVVIAGLALAGAVDGDVVRDGTLGPDTGVQPAGPDYLIPDTMGQYGSPARSNLFHSFLEFDLSAAQSATFSGPDSVARVLARVTGGASTIDGLLGSSIPGADLYLINPLGIVFGKNARLDVSGSFHATTADAVVLGSDGLFAAADPTTSLLSADPPSAFRFVGNGPVAPIEVNQSLLAVGPTRGLSLIGGDVHVRGADHPEANGRAANATLLAPGGLVSVVSVASAGDVTVAANGVAEPVGFDGLGAITLSASAALGPLDEGSNTVLDAAGDPGGRVVIRGGRLTMGQGGLISAATLGPNDHPGTAVDIDIAGEMLMEGFSEIGVSAFAGGDAGDVRIRAGSLTMRGNSASPAFNGFGTNANIGSRSFGGVGGGDGGLVDIAADTISIGNQAFLQSITFGEGRSGNIRLTADLIEVVSTDSFAFVSSSTAGSGDAGGVFIDAGDLLIEEGPGGSFTGIAVQVRSDAEGNPSGGTLEVKASGTVSLVNGGQLNGAVFHGAGNGATIDVSADALIIRGVVLDAAGEVVTVPQFFPSGIFSNVSDFVGFGGVPANGGDIVVNAREVILEDGGVISNAANFPSAGNAGDIRIDAGSLLLRNSGAIRNDAFGFGAGGILAVRADDVRIEGPSQAPSATGTGLFAQGGTAAQSASEIDLQVGSLSLLEGGLIRTTTFGMAPGGPVRIRADEILVSGVDSAVDDPRFPSGPPGVASEIVSGSLVFQNFVQFSGGDGGLIVVDADRLDLDAGGRITARSQTAGTGGSIELDVGRVRLGPGAEITVSSTESGDAGNISLDAARLSLMGGAILAEAEQADGGNITILGRQALFRDGRVSAAVGGGAGRGGNVTVRTGELVVLQRSTISANAVAGPGGSVAVTTEAFISDDVSTLSASSELGIDGTVAVNSPETDLEAAIVAPDVRFGDAAALLQARCSVTLASGSALTVTRGDGLPEAPDGFIRHGRPDPVGRVRTTTATLHGPATLASVGCPEP